MSYIKRLSLPLFLVSVMILLSISIFPIRYAEIDDTMMQAMLNGTLTQGEPGIYSVFNNIIFSSIIGYLYYYFPICEWYPLALLGLTFLSLFVIIYLVNSGLSGIKKVCVLLITAVGMEFVVNLQFTTTTGLCAAAGYFLLLSPTRHRWEKLLSFLLLLCSSLIRLEMFLLMSLCFLPFVVMEKLDRYKVLFLGILFLSIGLSVGFHHWAYHTGDWAFFTKFNTLRGQIDDNPHFDAQRYVQHNILLAQDIDLYRYFIYSEHLTLDKMRAIWNLSQGDFWDISNFWATLKKYYKVVVLMTGLTALNFLQRKYWLGLSAVIFGGLVYYISINHFAKERIVYPVVWAYTIFSLYNFRLDTRWMKVVPYAVVLFFGIKLIQFKKYLPKLNYNDTTVEDSKDIRETIAQNPKTTYIILSTAIYDVFTLSPFVKLPENIIITGWITNAPTLKERKDVYYHQNIFLIKPKAQYNTIQYIDNVESHKRLESISPYHFRPKQHIHSTIFFEKEK